MAYEPLHHKYRPQTFAELVGQDAIAQTLTNALRQQRIAPAYLFTGARGTGKTSSARIFAKSLNCLNSAVPTAEPCGKCQVCREITRGASLDIIEIDAASNTGVDNIRELIERAQFAPVQCRYKVYVIDEVHMLSTAAFNALLKTLEEPPDRVVFVLATTDPQKVLPTIISRCQRFDFRRIPLKDMVSHLQAIASKEAIPIATEAVQLVAQIAQGGLRDAESLLDQLSLLQGEITTERVWDLVGAVPERDLLTLVRAIASDHPSTVLDTARHLMDRGREPLIVLQNLAGFYRDLLIAKTAADRQDLVAITPPTWFEMVEFVQPFDLAWILAGQKHLRASEVQVKTTSQPRLWLEVTLMGLLPSALGHQASEVRSQEPGGKDQALGTGQKDGLSQGNGTVANQRQSPTPAVVPSTASPVKKIEIEPPPSEVKEEAIASSSSPVESTPVEKPKDPSVEGLTGAVKDSVQDLVHIWQQVLLLVQPVSTQIMLRQQCRLLGLSGDEVRMGTTSQPLFRMAKDRLPNIEAAFEQYCQHKVRVTLEVVTPAEGQPAVDTHRFSEPKRISKSPTPPSAPTEGRSPTTRAGDAPSPTTQEQPTAYSPAPPVNPAMPPSTEPNPLLESSPAPVPWQNEDEVLRAAKSFAQMFNGQIVSHEQTIEVQGVSDMSLDLGVASPGIDEDEDDVPF